MREEAPRRLEETLAHHGYCRAGFDSRVFTLLPVADAKKRALR